MPNKTKPPKCLRCNSRSKVKHVRNWLFECEGCKGLMDIRPDEEAVFHTDPTKRMREQESRREERRTLKGGFG